MIKEKAKIISNKRLKANYWHCVFFAPRICPKAKPGQFINVKVSEGIRPLLRRPFSIHRACGDNLEILYEVLGEGTRAFSRRKSAERIDIIGPLGNGFDCRNAGEVLLVGGGIGVAPLLYLAQELKSKSKTALIGARTKSAVLCEKEFKNSGCGVKIATDDGSAGFSGTVTELLKFSLKTNNQQLTTIYACGPRPMLKAVTQISEMFNIPSQLSLEEHMSCAIGACLGCVVKIKKGKSFDYQRVCKEGQVFQAQKVIF